MSMLCMTTAAPPRAEFEVLLQLLNPFAPHMTEELWQQMGHGDQLAYHPWPQYDEAKCVEQTVEIAVQVNGKVRARIQVPADVEAADAIAAAKAEPAVAGAIAGKTVVKEIYVKGKLVKPCGEGLIGRGESACQPLLPRGADSRPHCVHGSLPGWCCWLNVWRCSSGLQPTVRTRLPRLPSFCWRTV